MKKMICFMLTIVLVFAFSSVANAQITKDQYYARSFLSEGELEFYDAVYAYLEGTGEGIYLDKYGVDERRADQIYQFVFNDSPEFYNYYETYTKAEVIDLDEQLKEKSKEILSYTYDEMTDYDKFEVVYAYLARHIEYDYTAEKERKDPFESKEAADAQTIIGGLINGKAVCTGMASSLQYILYQLDIPCCSVTGDGHQWNIVKLENSWYITDLSAFEGLKAAQLYYRILADEKYYEWNKIKPSEDNPPMPEFSEHPFGAITYQKPKPTPTPTTTPAPKPQPTAAPVKASIQPEPTDAPVITEEGETNPAWWILLGVVTIAVITIIVTRKKKA